MLGIPLFAADHAGLAQLARHEREVLALLPTRVMPVRTPVDDDF